MSPASAPAGIVLGPELLDVVPFASDGMYFDCNPAPDPSPNINPNRNPEPNPNTNLAMTLALTLTLNPNPEPDPSPNPNTKSSPDHHPTQHCSCP